MGTRAPCSPRPRGRRGGARCDFISSSAGVARSEPVLRCASPSVSMQPRWQLLPAPGPGGPRPAAAMLALLLLLALQGAAAAPAGSAATEHAGWRQDTELQGGLLLQAARAALHFFNFRAGSPSALRVVSAVQQGRAWVSAGATRRGRAGHGHAPRRR